MAPFDKPLPTLNLDAERIEWAWPQPPLARCIEGDDGAIAIAAHPCRIETTQGAAVDGELLEFDASAGLLVFRMAHDAAHQSEPLALPFTKFRRLTLTQPWLLAPRAADAPVERLPPEAQAREVRVMLAGGGQLTGRTRGHVDQPLGVFLFAPSADGLSLLRQFIPKAAIASIEFGVSDEEEAARRWIGDAQALLAAIDQQRESRVLPLGQALLDLGLISRATLEMVMRDSSDEMPLGERLVARRLIDRAELQTAMAHKMGYPLVDLARFALDPQVLRLLPTSAIREHRALPLMQQGQRLIVAVDELSRVAQLQSLQSVAGLELVPVLAPPGKLTTALAAITLHRDTDLWASNVRTRNDSAGRF